MSSYSAFILERTSLDEFNMTFDKVSRVIFSFFTVGSLITSFSFKILQHRDLCSISFWCMFGDSVEV